MKKLSLLLGIFFLSAPLFATIINIPGEYPAIQRGINNSLNGDTVLVQPGTYIENIDFNGHNISVASLFLTTGDTSYISQTTIDGNTGVQYVSVVYFQSGEDSTTLLSGFTITGGTGTYTEPSNKHGGGILCLGSSPKIDHCIITENYVYDGYSRGGGIYFGDNSNAIISNCIISNNTVEAYFSSYGGGIAAILSDPIIDNCIIDNNISDGDDWAYGGGIHLGGSNPIIKNCLISNNSVICNISADGGGIDCGSADAYIVNCTIIGNEAGSYGGGIYCYANSANPGDLIVEDCYIADNIAHYGGGITISSYSIIRRCVLTGNSAEKGAGIRTSSYPLLENLSIVDNISTLQGGGIYSTGNNADPDILNSILWNNSPEQIWRQTGTPLTITYSDIMGGWEGEGNIDADPLFADPQNNNFQITWANFPEPDSTKSPCIDTGDPESPLDPDNTRTDMGALFFNQIGSGVFVFLNPSNPPIQIPANGGAFDFNIAVTNNDSIVLTFDIWTIAVLPDGREYGPIIYVENYLLGAGTSVNRDRTQNVPANAMPGNYTYRAYIGEYPNVIWDEDQFDFEKLPTSDNRIVLNDWKCEGEDFHSDLETAKIVNSEFLILNCYPNPFNPKTTLKFDLPEAGFVSLKVFDITGRSVGVQNFEPLHKWLPAGLHQISFNAENLSSGIYFARLDAGEFQQTQKLLLLK